MVAGSLTVTEVGADIPGEQLVCSHYWDRPVVLGEKGEFHHNKVSVKTE